MEEDLNHICFMRVSIIRLIERLTTPTVYLFSVRICYSIQFAYP